MELSSIKNKTVHGIFWNAVEKFSIQSVQFILGIVIARILSPRDFGLVGMLTIFLALAQVFIDSGFLKALIQKQDRTDADYSTVFYFNIFISIVLYIILFFCAPLIAGFYDISLLSSLTRVLSVVLIINAFTVVQTAQLMIRVDFKTIAKINFWAALGSGIIGIVAAYMGMGVWALVIQSISRSVLVVIGLWKTVRWLPLRVFSWISFHKLFRFGSKLLIAGSVSVVLNNIYSIVIGKLYLPRDLGYYTLANMFAELSSGTVGSVLQTVTYPMMSSLQQEKEQLRAVYIRLLKYTGMFVLPLMCMLALLAGPFIEVTLSDKWLPAASLLFWLALAYIFTPVSALNMNILNAVGRSDLYMKLDLSKVPLLIVMMVITFPISLQAVVMGRFVISFICFFINAYLPGKLLDYGAWKQITDLWKVILATLAETGIILLLSSVIVSPGILLFTGIVSGGTGYLLSLWLLREREFLLLAVKCKGYLKR